MPCKSHRHQDEIDEPDVADVECRLSGADSCSSFSNAQRGLAAWRRNLGALAIDIVEIPGLLELE